MGHEGWKDVRIELPRGAGAAPLRIDFVSALTTVEIESIEIKAADHAHFSATTKADFDSIAVGGDAERLAADNVLRFKITGIDPQLYLPRIETPDDAPLLLQLRLRVLPSL